MNSNFIILGPQGSGKSTQAQILVKKLNFEYIGTGDLIRNYIKKNNKLSEKIKKIINQGLLVPKNILYEKIIIPYISKLPNKSKILFDGIPRNTSQLGEFEKMIKKLKLTYPYLIYIKTSQEEIFKRISLRKICPKCNTPFSPYDQAYIKNICPKDKTKIIKRKDDNLISLKKRLEIFQKQTQKVIKYFKNKKLYIYINGNPSVKEVSKDIISKIIKIK